jgi:putative nucleotidyltransferase with HDIG domain
MLMNDNAKPRYDARTQIAKLTAITAALEIKDPYTRGHARRVAVYARRLAERIGLNAVEAEKIRLGGLLHDIGKIGLSEQLLNNTRNRLSADMLAEVRQHPQIGVAILKGFSFPKAVIDFVHFHHEKMDGSGYPHGLRSYQIPLGAKIIRVVASNQRHRSQCRAGRSIHCRHKRKRAGVISGPFHFVIQSGF